jgi:hypothetical protein
VDRAGATGSGATTILDTGQSNMIANDLEERRIRIDVDLDATTVDQQE